MFLVDFLKTIKDRALAAAVNRVLLGEEKSGLIRSAEEQKRELERLRTILSSAPEQKFTPQSGRTSSEVYNANAEKLRLSLEYLFDLYNELDRVVQDHARLLAAQIADVERGLAQLSGYLALLPPDAADVTVIREDFLAPRFLDTSEHHHEDRNGLIYGPESYAAVDLGCTLSFFVDRNCLMLPTGYRTAKVRLARTVGAPLQQAWFPVDMAVDGSPVTVWQETVWAPFPLDIAPVDVLASSPDDLEFYEDSRGGAYAELWVDFRFPVLASELKITPAGGHPAELVSAFVYEDIGGPYKKIASGILLDRTVVVHFPAVSCRRLRLLLRQPHYERKSYFIPAAALKETMLESELVQDLWFPEMDNVEERNYREYYRGWGAFVSEKDNEKITEVSCCEYRYGLREISVREKQYRDFSFLVSEAFALDGDARAVELEVEEEHPEVDLGAGPRPATAVEYYIGCDGEWFPIQPKNRPMVVNERIFGPVAELRFRVSGGLKVYKNGLPYEDFEVLDSKTLKINNYSGYAIYTADYFPSPEAYLLELPRVTGPKEYVSAGRRGEYFDGSDLRGVITLSHVPFLDYSRIVEQRQLAGDEVPRVFLPQSGSPVEVLVRDGRDYVPYTNVTDYIYGTERFPGDREFVHRGRKIIFSAPVSAPVIVYYKYLGGELRLKAVLRRCVHGYNSLTPVVKGYKLKVYLAR